MLALLIILDFFWALAALFVDLPKLLEIPPYLWLIVAVCPVYPFLLALVFLRILKRRKVNHFLLSLASFPSAIFGVLALVYYPLKMSHAGFNWIDFGQIFWVFFYSLQGWYLLINKKISFVALFSAFCFLCAKLIIDYKYLMFGYLDLTMLNPGERMGILILSLVASALVLLFAIRVNRRR
ncbi:MAG: hypothetical protein BWY43_00568 [candidate division WS2 bacterium ADurb.Bin280]|uniref:Uncharacterized protein n=1 Tax=candidate division WS2 bacterium ADurb.Bin280 TaxID=1852829 RepID=A0A1V5SD95_9BACT|nr:MAG: hypothetical protein BWY43_00568 [candidate division WS2 bacterium ADurb.Bin280]